MPVKDLGMVKDHGQKTNLPEMRTNLPEMRTNLPEMSISLPVTKIVRVKAGRVRASIPKSNPKRHLMAHWILKQALKQRKICKISVAEDRIPAEISLGVRTTGISPHRKALVTTRLHPVTDSLKIHPETRKTKLR